MVKNLKLFRDRLTSLLEWQNEYDKLCTNQNMTSTQHPSIVPVISSEVFFPPGFCHHNGRLLSRFHCTAFMHFKFSRTALKCIQACLIQPPIFKQKGVKKAYFNITNNTVYWMFWLCFLWSFSPFFLIPYCDQDQWSISIELQGWRGDFACPWFQK